MVDHIRSRCAWLPIAVALAAAAACGGSGGAAPQGQAGGRQGGAPAAGVKAVTLEQRPIAETSEFIATVRSLHSTTIQPQVEGVVSRIFVKSGDLVRAGTPLVQIDPEKQAANVRSIESNRAARRGQVQRLKALLDAGAISRNEYDEAQHQLETAQASLASLNAQVREGQVELRYYRVTAPQAGVVGDIPVRQGDRVTTSTVITTIDDTRGLEAYIQMPLERAPQAKVGLPVQILDEQGKVVATNQITFVAPRVDPATQTVLAKAMLRETPPSVKVQQFVRARVVWRSVPGLTIPIVAVTRVSGQYFCFVAEPGGQGPVARQRPVQVGAVLGNDYVVQGGLKPGDRVIVSGVQKLADGAPVRLE
ncbi:MAG: efflux RND transporter periplasmic adaptor subunit [Acidobacteria bacterium]|nr:MAG: efflux RND transporter periplasmic adaptor subunit [Acidobacteriota bacterium]